MARNKLPYTAEDMAIVSDNPPWTDEEIARAIPARDFFTPEQLASLMGQKPRARGPQKTPTKELVSLRLNRETLAAFRATGRGWQSRVDEELAKAAKRISKQAGRLQVKSVKNTPGRNFKATNVS